MSQQWVVISKTAVSTQVVIMDIWELEQEKMPLLCSMLVRTPLAYLINFWASNFKRNMDKSEQVQNFGTGLAKGLGTM